MFYTGDWLKDPAVRRCSLAARGAVFDLVCLMHAGGTYEITATPDEFARMIGCSPEQWTAVLGEIDRTQALRKTLRVTDSNAEITLTSRRLEREHKSNTANAKRQKRHRERRRSNAKVTPRSSCSSSTSVMSTSETGVSDPRPPSASEKQCDAVLAAWNELASRHGLPTVRKLTPKRTKTLKARLRDPDWRASWAEALAEIPKSSFLTGEKGWRANFNWFLRPDTVTRILEGDYAGSPGKAQTPMFPDVL
jgi:hypothetical protein